MARVVFSAAQDDFRQLRTFVGKDSPAAAKALAQRLRDEAARLGRFPRGGRIVPEFGDSDIRELIVPHYRGVYRLRADASLARVIGVVLRSRMTTEIDDRT